MTKEIAISKPLFNREEFLKLKTKQEKEEYLRGANLIRADLSFLNLIFLNLSGLDFSHADLREADLREADFRYANLSGADFRLADFRRADFRYANLSGADLSGANLSFANLRYANLSGAILSGAILRGSDLRGSDLTGANLSFADLRADLKGSKLPKHKIAKISCYRILIFESHIQVGCHAFSYEEFLQDKAEELTRWEESEKKIFIRNKEEIIKLVQEFNLNKGEEND